MPAAENLRQLHHQRKLEIMSFLKDVIKWGSSATATAAVDQELIDLEAKRIRLLFEALKEQGFTEDQAVDIVAGRSV